jgi:hypothetical protein
MRIPTRAVIVAMAMATIPSAVVTMAPAGVAAADVCASVGRRVSVSGCN